MTPTSPVLKALRFAEKAHAGQKRTSGEPFLTHLTAVTDLLREIGADEETLTAALLHDTIEDTEVTAARLRKEFGPTVTNLVEGVTKVQQLEKTFDKRQRNMESIRKMFRTMGKDFRVLFIKLADRLHNMRTIDAVPIEKQVRIARETQDIYCPLAHLIGIRPWYEELSELCFGVLDPVESEFVRRKFAQTWKEQHKSFEKWISRLNEYLQKHNAKVSSVELRSRRGREVRNESINQEALLQQIESFHSVQILLPDNANPYQCMGIAHQFASPLPGGIDDYIASPKVNGYQALHTCVLDSAGNPVTLVFQTESMNRNATYGLATLFSAGKGKRMAVPDWVEALLTLDEDEQDLQAFFMRVQSEIFGERNHLQLIAKGERKSIDLPSYASVLDLAFYASEKIAVHASSATINGRPASLKTLLRDGDVVELGLDAKPGVRRADDLYFVHTALGHKHLVTHLAALSPQERKKRGEKVLRNAFQFTMDPFFSVGWQQEVFKRLDTTNDTLQKIGSGMIDGFLAVEEQGLCEEFFLLDPQCFELPSGMLPGPQMRYVLRTSMEDLRQGNILGIQVGPDVIDIVAAGAVKRAREKLVSKEIVPLKVKPNSVQFPFLFALKWTFDTETNPLRDIAVLESFLDTPVHLLRFEPTSVTLGFRTDRLRTLQIGYKYLYSLPHVREIFRLTP
jgi:GTP pyrophosphokinase